MSIYCNKHGFKRTGDPKCGDCFAELRTALEAAEARALAAEKERDEVRRDLRLQAYLEDGWEKSYDAWEYETRRSAAFEQQLESCRAERDELALRIQREQHVETARTALATPPVDSEPASKTMKCPTCGRKPEEVVRGRTFIGPPTAQVIEFRCKDRFHTALSDPPLLSNDRGEE